MLFRVMLTIFCFFQATGSFPVDLAGARLSNLYTLLLCVAMPFFLIGGKALNRKLLPLALIGIAFIFWQSFSVIWSVETGFSAYRALVVSGYMFLAFTIPLAAIDRRVDVISIYGNVAVWSSALLIICAVVFLPVGARAVYPQLFLPSMTLEPLDDFDLNDPNIVACALSLGLICAFASIHRRSLRAIGVVLCAIAILLTQSRTALLFLPATGLLAAVATRRAKAAFVSLLIIVVIAGAGIAAYKFLGDISGNQAVSEALQDRLTSDSGSNEDRLDRLDGAFAALQQPWIALLGLGAGGSISSGLEPHNMFLSFFLELGIFGLFLFCAIFILVGRLVFSIPNAERRFYCAWSLLFIFSACLTYWHTRTLWFSLSVILFEILRSKRTAIRHTQISHEGSRLKQRE